MILSANNSLQLKYVSNVQIVTLSMVLVCVSKLILFVILMIKQLDFVCLAILALQFKELLASKQHLRLQMNIVRHGKMMFVQNVLLEHISFLMENAHLPILFVKHLTKPMELALLAMHHLRSVVKLVSRLNNLFLTQIALNSLREYVPNVQKDTYSWIMVNVD